MLIVLLTFCYCGKIASPEATEERKCLFYLTVPKYRVYNGAKGIATAKR